MRKHDHQATHILTCIIVILKHELKHHRPITGNDVEDLIKNKDTCLQEMGISDGSLVDDDLIR